MNFVVKAVRVERVTIQLADDETVARMESTLNAIANGIHELLVRDPKVDTSKLAGLTAALKKSNDALAASVSANKP